jgi:phosphocarrier protein FPr
VSASPGLAIGAVHVLASAELTITDTPVDLATAARAQRCSGRTRAQMVALIDDTTRRLGAGEAAIFKAQATLLDDTDLITLTCQMMVEGHGVAWSWHQAVERMAGNCRRWAIRCWRARGRSSGCGRRVLAQIDPGLGIGTLADLPDAPCILVAEDLSPSDTALLDTAKVWASPPRWAARPRTAPFWRALWAFPRWWRAGRSCSRWLRAARRSSMAMPAASG